MVYAERDFNPLGYLGKSFFEETPQNTLQWESIYRNGLKVGFKASSKDTLHATTYSELNIKENGTIYPLKILQENFYHSQEIPDKLTQQVFYKGKTFITEVTTNNKTISITRSSYKDHFSRIFSIPPNTHWQIPYKLFAKHLGENLTYTMFSFSSPNYFAPINAIFMQTDTVMQKGNEVLLYKYLIKQEDITGFSYYTWVDQEGNFIKTQDITTDITTEIINQQNTPEKADFLNSHNLFILNMNTPLVPNEDLHSIDYQVSFHTPIYRDYLVENSLQTLESSGSANLLVKRKHNAPYNHTIKKPVKDLQAQPYLYPNNYFIKTLSETRKTALSITGNTQDIAIAIKQLAKWVYNMTSKQDINVNICLPTVYCNISNLEKTAILNNLALSADIPVKLIAGLKSIATEDGQHSFIPHIWLETYISSNTWAGFDPSSPTIIENPGYITFKEPSPKNIYTFTDILQFIQQTEITPQTFSSPKQDILNINRTTPETSFDISTSQNTHNSMQHIDLATRSGDHNSQQQLILPSKPPTAQDKEMIINDDFLTAVKYFQEGNINQAIQHFSMASENIPFDNLSLRYELGVKLSEFMLYSLAHKEFKRIQDSGLTNDLLNNKINSFKKLNFDNIHETHSSEKDTSLAYSFIFYHNTQQNPESLLIDITSRNPDYYPAFYTLGLLYKNQSMIDEAIRCFHQTLGMNPYFIKAYFALADVHEQNNNLKEAIHILSNAQHLVSNPLYKDNSYVKQINHQLKRLQLTQALSQNPKNLAAHQSLAMLYIDLQDYDKAKKTAQRIINLAPKHPGGFDVLCTLYNRQSKFMQASDNCQKALQYGVSSVKIKNLLAALETQKYNYKNAESLYKQVLQLNNKYIDAYTGLIDLYILQNQYTKARITLQKASFSGIKSIGLSYRQAIIDAQLNKGSSVTNQLITLAKSNPDNDKITSLLAVLLLQENNLKEAQYYAVEALITNNKNKDAHAVLGEIYELSNLPKEAYLHYKIAYHLNPTSKKLYDSLITLHQTIYRDKEHDIPPPKHNPTPTEFQKAALFLKHCRNYLDIKAVFITQVSKSLPQGSKSMQEEEIEHMINFQQNYAQKLGELYKDIYIYRNTPKLEGFYTLLLANIYNEVNLSKEFIVKLDNTETKNMQEFLNWFMTQSKEIGEGISILETAINALFNNWEDIKYEQLKEVSGYSMEHYRAKVLSSLNPKE